MSTPKPTNAIAEPAADISKGPVANEESMEAKVDVLATRLETSVNLKDTDVAKVTEVPKVARVATVQEDPEIRIITFEELAKHNTRESMWTALYGIVYDMTTYPGRHPGGPNCLLKGAGKEATAQWKAVKHHHVHQLEEPITRHLIKIGKLEVRKRSLWDRLNPARWKEYDPVAEERREKKEVANRLR